MGELTQSFAQVTNAINQTKQQNLNRDVAQANFSFTQQANDLANRQFEAQQVQQQRDNLIENADKSLNFYTTVGPLLPPKKQQELFQETSNRYKEAGVIPEGTAFDFESAEEASNRVNERVIRGDMQGAQDAMQEFKTSGFKSVVDANLPKIQADAAIAERAGNYKNIIDLRSKGMAVSESELEHIKQVDPDRARRLQEGKNVYSDASIQAADARSTELDYWRKVPPEILNDIINIKRIADIGGVVSSADMQKQVAASQYQSLATLAANEEAAGNVVPDSLTNAMNVQLAVMGVGEKIPVENEQAKLERRRLKAQEADIRSRISNRTIENSRIIAQTNVLNATVPKINQTIENMKATEGNIQARTALFENQLKSDQKKMQAIAPRLTQARDELMQQGEEIYAQLEATAHDRSMDPLEREKLYDQLDANAKAVTDLNAQIEFAEAVGPDLFLSYEKLGAQIKDMELRRTKNDTTLNSLQQQRQALAAAQTEGKLEKNRRDQATFQQEQDAIKVAQEGARRGLKFDDTQAVQGLADELGANAPLNLIRKSAGLPETANAKGEADGGFSAPITLPGGKAGTIRVKPDNESPTGFSAVEIPTPGKPGETTPLMSEKTALVQFGSAGEREKDVSNENILQSTNSLIDRFDSIGKYVVGPVDQFTTNVKRIAGLVPEDRLLYEKDLNKLAGEYRHELFGSALTAAEVKSALGFIPSMDDQDNDHLAKLKSMKKTTERMKELRAKSMGKRIEKIATMSNEDRMAELRKMGATYDEALRIMVEEGRE